jgi:hypothetical protein
MQNGQNDRAVRGRLRYWLKWTGILLAPMVLLLGGGFVGLVAYEARLRPLPEPDLERLNANWSMPGAADKGPRPTVAPGRTDGVTSPGRTNEANAIRAGLEGASLVPDWESLPPAARQRRGEIDRLYGEILTAMSDYERDQEGLNDSQRESRLREISELLRQMFDLTSEAGRATGDGRAWMLHFYRHFIPLWEWNGLKRLPIQMEQQDWLEASYTAEILGLQQKNLWHMDNEGRDSSGNRSYRRYYDTHEEARQLWDLEVYCLRRQGGWNATVKLTERVIDRQLWFLLGDVSDIIDEMEEP